MHIHLHVKYLQFLSDISATFSRHIFKKYSYIRFYKILPVGAELVYADRKTDMTKLIVVLR